MTEAKARDSLTNEIGVPRETMAQLEHLVALILAANRQQNLISDTSASAIWQRHILDSAQLAQFAVQRGLLLDLGSGAGLPGLVLAILRPQPVVLVESRKLRIAFLNTAIAALGLSNARVHGGLVEKMPQLAASVITARAFAPLPKIFALAHRFTIDDTLWVLPKGRRADEEIDAAKAQWSGMFHVEQSLSDAEAGIVIAQNVSPRGLAKDLR